MNGIVLINKEKGFTSRDVVNQVAKKLNTRKVGHAGTLDPLATGLLVIGVGKATKILELLTLDTKEYIATVKLGIKTDTMDITGNTLYQDSNINLLESDIKNTLNSFIGTYYQTVPKYSAVKINGKKLYEYARNNIDIELPKRLVEIFKIELISYNKETLEFTFKTLVSKGTYIRSLIDDISKKLGVYATMKDLERVKSGKFSLEKASKVANDLNFISIKDALDLETIVVLDTDLLKKVKNGNVIHVLNSNPYILFLDSNKEELAIYKKEELNTYKAFKVF